MYVAYGVRLSVSLILLTHFEVICELLRSLKKTRWQRQRERHETKMFKEQNNGCIREQ